MYIITNVSAVSGLMPQAKSKKVNAEPNGERHQPGFVCSAVSATLDGIFVVKTSSCPH